jgi:tRNA(Ile)-lysidine synthase TilS/MesJ
MALCVLLRQHQKEYGWPEDVVAYTIDHGVRTGSTGEAKTVAKMVKNHFGTVQLREHHGVLTTQDSNIEY